MYSRTRRNCAVGNCPTNNVSCDQRGHLFNFPKNINFRNKWLKNLKRDDLSNKTYDQIRKYSVCKLHFSDHQFRTSDKCRLNIGVIPNPVEDVFCTSPVSKWSCEDDPCTSLRANMSAATETAVGNRCNPDSSVPETPVTKRLRMDDPTPRTPTRSRRNDDEDTPKEKQSINIVRDSLQQGKPIIDNCESSDISIKLRTSHAKYEIIGITLHRFNR